MRAKSSTTMGWMRIVAYFGLFILVLFAVDRALDYGLRSIETSAFGVTNRIVSGRINADIVISGSSRALCHYNPLILEQATGRTAFNIGRNGSQTDMQLAVLKTYLQHNTKPRLVIHNLDLFSFLTSREIYDPAQYLPYLDEEPIYQGVRRVYPDAWKWKYLPLYGYAVQDMRLSWLLGLKRLVGIQPREDHVNGFIGRNWRWTDDFEKFRQAHPNGVRTEIEPQGFRDLEELLQVCRDAQVPLILVYSPEYFEIHALQANRAEIFAKFAELSERYAVPLWDFSHSAISRQREYFYNSQHLNADGAAAFSQSLAQQLATSDFSAQALGLRD